jgi:hypothetical protein
MKTIYLLTTGVLTFLGIYTVPAAQAADHESQKQAIQEVLSHLEKPAAENGLNRTCYPQCRIRCRP